MQEAMRLVARLHDVAVMRKSIEQCGGHLGVAEHARPFGEVQRLVAIITLVCSYSLESKWNNNAPPAWLKGR